MSGGSTGQSKPEPGPSDPRDGEDDVIKVDSVWQPPRKRKGEGDEPNPRPKKRQVFWVEVPPRRKRALLAPAKRELSSPEAVVVTESETLTVEQKYQSQLPSKNSTECNCPHVLDRRRYVRKRDRQAVFPSPRGSRRLD